MNELLLSLFSDNKIQVAKNPEKMLNLNPVECTVKGILDEKEYIRAGRRESKAGTVMCDVELVGLTWSYLEFVDASPEAGLSAGNFALEFLLLLNLLHVTSICQELH